LVQDFFFLLLSRGKKKFEIQTRLLNRKMALLECKQSYLIVANFMYLHRFNQVFFVISKRMRVLLVSKKL